MPCQACIERQEIITKAKTEGRSVMEIAKLLAEHAFSRNQGVTLGPVKLAQPKD